MNNLQFLVNRLNEEFNRIHAKNFKNIGKFENLKLYDVANMVNDKDITWDDFDRFCQDMNENGFNVMLNEHFVSFEQYRRTSSHYFNMDDFDMFDLYSPIAYQDKTDKEKGLMLLDTILSHLYNICLQYDNEQITGFHEWDIEELENDYTQEELKEIIKESIDLLRDSLYDLNKAYKWLKDFKYNQVTFFKYWLKHNKGMYL